MKKKRKRYAKRFLKFPKIRKNTQKNGEKRRKTEKTNQPTPKNGRFFVGGV